MTIARSYSGASHGSVKMVFNKKRVAHSQARRLPVTRRAFLVTSAAVFGPLVGLAWVAKVRANLDAPSLLAPVIRQDDDQTSTRREPPVISQSQHEDAMRAAQEAQAAAAAQAAQLTASSQAPPSLRALVYLGLPDPDAPASIRAESTTLSNLVREPGQPWRLRGRLVEVVNQGVLIERDSKSGKLQGVAMGNAETNSPDGFDFKPRSGGELQSVNEDQGGAANVRMREAGRFGEANAYYYADRTIAMANSLLSELREPPLPLLRVVVNAHPGSQLPGYGENDGEDDDGKLRPFPGGHYRRPTIFKTDGRFLHPVETMNPFGEVHLGPGREYITDSKDRDVVVDGQKYVRNASHVPGIITHETGHHINEHVADFLANRSRKANEYINKKIHMDEGTADYWAAVVLETPDIYSWQHAAEGRDDRDNRNLGARRTADDFDFGGDEHRNGTIWSTTLWEVRTALGAHETDLLVMKWLVLCAKVGPEGSSESAIQQQMERKDEMRDGLAILLKADEALYQGKNRAKLLKIFERRGIDPTTPDKRLDRD